MKNILSLSRKLLVLTLAASAFAACEKEYTEPDKSIQMQYFGVSDGIDDGSGSPNIEPSIVTTREMIGLMDISLGYNSHEWHLLEREDENSEWKYIDPFDIQFFRTNSGVPSTIIEDYDPLLYTMKEPMPTVNDVASLLFYYDVPGEYNLRIRNIYSDPIQYSFSTFDLVYGVKSVRWFNSVPVAEGHLVERNFEFKVYKKLEGECQIYTDAARTQKLIDFDFRSDDYKIVELQKGTTLYYSEISGNTEYDEVDVRKWIGEGYKINLNDELPASLPTISDATAKETAITFNDIGAYRVILNQQYNAPSDILNAGSFPGEENQNPIPVIIKIVE